MNAERLLAHYEKIADAPDAIAHLRRFILDLAVRGKLVPQEPGDEPASELLKRIGREKARLVRAGEIRKPKPLPAVDEPPFDLPQNWCWTRMREITSDRGQRIPDATFTYIDVTAIDKEAGVVADPKVLEANEASSRARKVTRKGDVIYSCVRPYLLNVAVIEEDFDPEPIVSTAFAILNGHGFVLPRYLWIVLRSPFMVECVDSVGRHIRRSTTRTSRYRPPSHPSPSNAASSPKPEIERAAPSEGAPGFMIGGMANLTFQHIGQQYFDAAYLLCETIRNGEWDDHRLGSVLYLYRHSIELFLKAALGGAAKTHGLGGLSDQFRAFIKNEFDAGLPEWISKRLKELAAIDPGSMAFRYSRNYDRALKADVPVDGEFQVDLAHLQSAMAALNTALVGVIAAVACGESKSARPAATDRMAPK